MLALIVIGAHTMSKFHIRLKNGHSFVIAARDELDALWKCGHGLENIVFIKLAPASGVIVL